MTGLINKIPDALSFIPGLQKGVKEGEEATPRNQDESSRGS
jgi:hypothetical protein